MRRSDPSRPRSTPVVNPHAAAIDLGSREHFVCAGGDHPVRSFGCFTSDLRALVAWLKRCRVTTVAMEATGVTWIPLYELLESEGVEVALVNAKLFKSVPGRKSDVQDCQWLQYLHECGLLRGSFRPAADIVMLRTYLRQRANLIREAAQHIQRMQKALEQMNVQLHKVVSDLTGETGQRIIAAILAGEREPAKLAALRNYRVRRRGEDYVAALEGDWRADQLFCLRQAWTVYHQLQAHVAECDTEIARCCAAWNGVEDAPPLPPAKNHRQDGALREQLYRALGVDLTAIHGMSPQSVLTILGEVGMDMTKWPSADHFVSWLRLCPNNRITGGRVHGARPLPTRNRAAEVFRKCAENIARTHSYFGAFYRRLRARKGGPYAVVATAGKMARVFYRCLRDRTPYRDAGEALIDAAQRDRATKRALHHLRSCGFDINISELRRVSDAVR